MSMKRMRMPSAGQELRWIGNNYNIAEELEAWTKEITASADRAKRPLTEVSFEDASEILEELGEPSMSDWERSWEKFRDAGWLDKFRALKVVLLKRTPPWQLKINSKIFPGLNGAVSVEVEAVYDINHIDKSATFIAFQSYTPSSSDRDSSNQAKEF